MAIATYSPGIEFVQGSLAKPKKKESGMYSYLCTQGRGGECVNFSVVIQTKTVETYDAVRKK